MEQFIDPIYSKSKRKFGENPNKGEVFIDPIYSKYDKPVDIERIIFEHSDDIDPNIFKFVDWKDAKPGNGELGEVFIDPIYPKNNKLRDLERRINNLEKVEKTNKPKEIKTAEYFKNLSRFANEYDISNNELSCDIVLRRLMSRIKLCANRGESKLEMSKFAARNKGFFEFKRFKNTLTRILEEKGFKVDESIRSNPARKKSKGWTEIVSYSIYWDYIIVSS